MTTLRPRAYTVRDACREIGCAKTKLYELLSEGALDARKSGGTTLIMGQSIDRYLENLPRAEIHMGLKVGQRRELEGVA